MTLFDEPAFIKPTHPKGDVIVFRRSPDLEIADTKNRVARFGGLWRTPSYFIAYVRSAEILIEHAAQHNTLDDIALPAFYMQRHTLELLIKRLLSWLYEAAEYRSELGQSCPAMPSTHQRKNFKRSHNLSRLLNNLRVTSKAFGFPEPPDELAELVQRIGEFEKSDTWSRYEVSESKDGGIVHHIQKEIVLPLVDFQRRLELVVSKTAYQFNGHEAYENDLY
ncbi:MAG: hypothetical protein ACRERU_21335, partial [Methylococcales bacterium]